MMTKDLLRWALASAIGIIIAFGLIYLFQYAGSNLSPDVYDPDTGEVLILVGSTIALLLGWFLGTFAGGWLSMRISQSPWTGWMVAGAVVGAALYRAITLADTWWIMAFGLIFPLAAAWAAQRVTTTATVA